jgi:hypothetical protein
VGRMWEGRGQEVGRERAGGGKGEDRMWEWIRQEVGREWGGCGTGESSRWEGESAGDMSERAVGMKGRQQEVGILRGKAGRHGTKCCS